MLRVSTRKLLDLVHDEQIPLVIFGHDREQESSKGLETDINPNTFMVLRR